MRNFKELKIWQKGFGIAVDTFKLINIFPGPENMLLHNQQRKPLPQYLQRMLTEVAAKVKKITIGLLKFSQVLHLNGKHSCPLPGQ